VFPAIRTLRIHLDSGDPEIKPNGLAADRMSNLFRSPPESVHSDRGAEGSMCEVFPAFRTGREAALLTDLYPLALDVCE